MGQALSNPITSLGIERKGNGFVRSAAVSMQGWRIDMEDEHNIELGVGSDRIISLFGVYDGHGGAKASQYIRTKLPSLLNNTVASLANADTKKKIEDMVVHQQDAQFLADGKDDGSTCCFVLTQAWDMKNDKPLDATAARNLTLDTEGNNENIAFKCLAVNIGDSRAMIIRKDGTWISLTKDHKPTDDEERRRIINAGGTVTNQRVDGNLALSRAIGDGLFKKNDRLPVTEQKVISVPDFTEETIYPGDVLVVACDGLYESQEMTWEHVADLTYTCVTNLVEKKGQDWDPAVVARDLVEQSLLHESRDNHTVIVTQFSNGNQYITPKRPAFELVPGKYHENDDTFNCAYRDDLVRHGLSLRQVDEIVDNRHNNNNAANVDAVQMIEIREFPHNPPTTGFPPELMSQFINLLQNNSEYGEN